MKRFFRTVAGKTAIIIFLALFILVFAGSFLCSVVLWDENAYYRSEQEFVTGIDCDDFDEFYDSPYNSYYDDFEMQLRQRLYSVRYAIYPIGGAAFLFSVILFVFLMCLAGRKPDTEDLCPGVLDKVPFEIILALVILAVGGYAAILLELEPDIIPELAAAVLGFFPVIASVLLMCMELASRLKRHVLWKSMLSSALIGLIWKALRAVGKFLKILGGRLVQIAGSVPLIWRTSLAIVGICFIEFMAIMIAEADESILLLWTLEKLVLIPVIMYLALNLRKLQTAGQALAMGDISFRTDTSGMFGDFKQHGNNLNSISEGMSQAVEQRIKSERMKTELITNVSHDLKTPLTSIVNYVTLISNEETENERIHEYSEVLVRQSDKLKRLIEDLVEASKASTGNLEVNTVPCDAAVFVGQAAGEYEEKLHEAGLTLITSVPEKEVQILADSRRMWRVFDNLINNIRKYSQEGTRVYLSLEVQKSDAVFCFKNVSRDQLNIGPDELMERFVRGETSRHSEGNGLGLSIARSLTELQGGSFTLEVDADLFKVILRFPTI